MKTIPLSQGKVALVDDADYETVSQFKWHATKHGQKFYAARKVKKPNGKWTTQYLHQFLMPGVEEIGHQDGNGCNDQRENLRSLTHKENLQGFAHKKIGTTSRFRGVCWDKRNSKWRARIYVGGKHKCLGRFDSEKEAARARDAAARVYFKFPHLNFP